MTDPEANQARPDPADLAELLRSMRVRTVHDRVVADLAADELDRLRTELEARS